MPEEHREKNVQGLINFVNYAAKPVDWVAASQPTEDRRRKTDNKIQSGSQFFSVLGPRSPVAGGACKPVQLWCNQRGKDGNYGLNGHSLVDPIERMNINYPHKRCVQSPHRIRSQTLYPLSYGCVWGYYTVSSGEGQIWRRRGGWRQSRK
jgi:hypothetical protein